MKKLIAKLATLPQYSKNDNFTMALVDYLYNELKLNGISARREKSYVKVALSNKYEGKFEHIIIDCCDGRMYLRGKDCKDKRWGKLSKFNLKRKSDAYVCANYNARRIINRIKKLEDKMMEKVEMIQKEKFSLASSTSIDDEVNYYLYDLDTDINETEKEPVEVDIIDSDNDEIIDLDAEDEIIELDDDTEAYPYCELDENDVVEEYPFYDLDDYDGEIEAYIFVEPMEKEVMDELVHDLMEGNYIELSDEDVVDVYPYYDLEDDDEVEAYPYYELDENDVDEAYTFDNLSEEEQTELLHDMLDENYIDIKTASDEDKPLDKLMAQKDAIFDEYFKNFFQSQELTNFIQKQPLTYTMSLGVEDLVHDVKDNYRKDIADFVKNKLNISVDDTNFDKDIYDVFSDYVFSNEKKLFDKLIVTLKNVAGKMLDDFSKQLENNNDQVGRKIDMGNGVIDTVDIINRSKPFLFLDGEVHVGKNNQTHSDILRELNKTDKEGMRRPTMNDFPDDAAVAFGHISGKIGFLDGYTKNCSDEEVAKAVVQSGVVSKVYTTPDGGKYITRLANNKLAWILGE